MDTQELQKYLNKKFQGRESFLETILYPIFGENNFNDAWDVDVLDDEDLLGLAQRTGIKSAIKYGTFNLPHNTIDIFEVTVSNRVQMQRNRVNIQQLVRRIMDTYSSAFIIFHYDSSEVWDWRFSFCQKDDKNLTEAKRYTFLLGPGQSCRTAADNFNKLFSLHGNVSRDDIVKAFDVEALSKEFFEKYKQHYEAFCQFVYDNKDNRGYFGEEFSKWEDKTIRDYVKKLLGRIVFLHFLQKKGWMGVPADKDWGDGDMDFMRHLFLNATESQKNNYLDEVLEDLFSKALDTDRTANSDLYDTKVEGFRNVKIPYLNGGLFERDYLDEPKSRFDAELFAKLFEFFYQYNFTIDENDPNDAQVGVDPEMLGRIFENLLEDNKDKGAFYTPKEIVQYMCKESLIAYLQTDVKGEETKTAIRNFVTTYDVDVLGGKDSATAKDIDELLKSVKICDPAIGSGAFPMGLLKELFYCRGAIEAFDNAAEIKRHIIQQNIYGVDIEKGAVDIARLRFWLALIVDEKTPHALPNMDFKIMQGNSLSERYKDIPLCNLASQKQEGQPNLFDDMLDVYRRELRHKITDFYDCKNHEERKILKENIVEIAVKQLREDGIKVDFSDIDILNNKEFFLWHTWFADVFEKGGFNIVIGNPPYIDAKKLKSQSNVLKNFDIYNGAADIFTYFYEQGFNFLEQDGILTLITSNKWMRSEYGRNLRHLLLSYKLLYLLDFGRNRLFNATVDTDITISRKSQGNNENIVCSLNDVDLRIGIYKALKENCISNFELTDNSWLITKGEKDFIKALLDKCSNSIKGCGVNVYRGILTGCNMAYHVELDKKEEICSKDSLSVNIIKPLIRGVETDRFVPKQNKFWLLNVHNGLKGNIRHIDIEDYPAIKEHLDCYYADIVSRGDKGCSPYNLRNCAYLLEFDRPKIIWQGVSKRVAYCYDEEGKYYCDVTSFFMTGEHLKLILAILNSKLFEYSLLNIYLEGDTFKSKNKIIQDFPVPPFTLESESNIVSYVNQILSAKKENPNSDTTSLETQIDRLVYELYGLTNAEVKIIDPEAQVTGTDNDLFKA